MFRQRLCLFHLPLVPPELTICPLKNAVQELREAQSQQSHGGGIGALGTWPCPVNLRLRTRKCRIQSYRLHGSGKRRSLRPSHLTERTHARSKSRQICNVSEACRESLAERPGPLADGAFRTSRHSSDLESPSLPSKFSLPRAPEEAQMALAVP